MYSSFDVLSSTLYSLCGSHTLLLLYVRYVHIIYGTFTHFRNINSLLEDIQELLDTPSKKSLWFYILNLLSNDHRIYCERKLGNICYYQCINEIKHKIIRVYVIVNNIEYIIYYIIYVIDNRACK